MAGDYIRREAAIEAVKHAWAKGLEPSQYIEILPAADVAEVVRCKNCIYGDYDSKPNGAMVCLRTNDGFWRQETDFCSYGERREGGNDNVSD